MTKCTTYSLIQDPEHHLRRYSVGVITSDSDSVDLSSNLSTAFTIVLGSLLHPPIISQYCLSGSFWVSVYVCDDGPVGPHHLSVLPVRVLLGVCACVCVDGPIGPQVWMAPPTPYFWSLLLRWWVALKNTCFLFFLVC